MSKMAEAQEILWQHLWIRFHEEHRQGGGTEEEIAAMNNETVADYMISMDFDREILELYGRYDAPEVFKDAVAFVKEERSI